jgi:hypothetical protein
MLLNEYEIEFMFRKIRNIRNLGNVHIRGPHIVMSRTDAQNGLDFHFKLNVTGDIETLQDGIYCCLLVIGVIDVIGVYICPPPYFCTPPPHK